MSKNSTSNIRDVFKWIGDTLASGDKLKKNEQVNLILLTNKQRGDSDKVLEKIQINELILDYPEVFFFLGDDNSVSLDKVIESVDGKLPSYYAPNVLLGDQFYQSFLIEFVISNDSRGEILSMGGRDYTDGFSLSAQRNQIQFVITNKDTGESKQVNSGYGNIPRNNESNWSKHQIFWNTRDLKLNYWIGGYSAAEIDFKGPLGELHPPITIGGDPLKHNYGNLKLLSLKIWDKEITGEQISNVEAVGEPIYELVPEQLAVKGKSFNANIASEEATIDAYGHISNRNKVFLEIKNSLDKSKLLTNFLVKSALELLNKNYDESAKYLKYTFALNQGGENDHLQFHIGSMLLQKIKDSELATYMENSPRAQSTNWKLDFILNSLKKRSTK